MAFSLKMLRIEMSKHADGSIALRCTRADGSVTWQKQTRQAAHFALHDLTHYAVETALGYRRGFFGLIADGWDAADTEEFNRFAPRRLSAEEIQKVRALRGALFEKWFALGWGAALELQFGSAATPGRSPAAGSKAWPH